jgi:hypothetical protein
LIPDDQTTLLKRLFYGELLRLDLAATQLFSEGPTSGKLTKWSEMQSYILNDLAAKLDSTIDGFAAALGLKYDMPSET